MLRIIVHKIKVHLKQVKKNQIMGIKQMEQIQLKDLILQMETITLIKGVKTVKAINGSFNFSEAIIVTDPNSQIKIKVLNKLFVYFI